MRKSSVTQHDVLMTLARMQAELGELREEIRDRTQSAPMMYDVAADKERAVTQKDWDKTGDDIRKLVRFRQAVRDLDDLFSGVLNGSVSMKVFEEATASLRHATHATLHN